MRIEGSFSAVLGAIRRNRSFSGAGFNAGYPLPVNILKAPVHFEDSRGAK